MSAMETVACVILGELGEAGVGNVLGLALQAAQSPLPLTVM